MSATTVTTPRHEVGTVERAGKRYRAVRFTTPSGQAVYAARVDDPHEFGTVKTKTAETFKPLRLKPSGEFK